MGKYQQWNEDPIFDAMFESVLARKDADEPFTATDLAQEVASTVREFGVSNFEDHPQDGLIDESYWAHRFSKLAPQTLCDVLADFLEIKTPRTKRSHRVLFAEVILTRPTLAAASLAAVKADARLAELDLR